MDIEYIRDNYPELMVMDGFDDCIIGVTNHFTNNASIAYSMEKVFDKLVKDGMSHDEAVEYFEFNMLGAYVGEYTPTFINDMS
jgi:hypothetical protein|tara:strand:+ start:24323 stop:24571 length:249 start_codon:yes stop_codon:yes gene_type:complete